VLASRPSSSTIFKPKGSRFYWIAYVSGGKRHYEGTKSEKKGDAQTLLTDRLGDVGKGIAVTPKMGKKTLAQGLKAVINDLFMNGRKSVMCDRCKKSCCGEEGHTNSIQRQIDKHILFHPATPDTPEGGYFRSERLMSTITTSDLTAYVAPRLAQKAAPVSVNYELATIRRAFRLAVRDAELVHMPHVPMLTLNNARQGLYERHEFDAVLAHLPAEYHAPVRFAFVTGWRLKSEVLLLTADRVDRRAGVVRLDPGTTKNNEGRSFYVTAELAKILKAQLESIAVLKEKDTICPYLFHPPDGSQIKDFRKAWETACEKAGHAGKLFHDFRRRPCVRSNAPACRARRRWRWWDTKPNRFTGAMRSSTRRCTARPPRSSTRGRTIRRPRPSARAVQEAPGELAQNITR
jgi:integrase